MKAAKYKLKNKKTIEFDVCVIKAKSISSFPLYSYYFSQLKTKCEANSRGEEIMGG